MDFKHEDQMPLGEVMVIDDVHYIKLKFGRYWLHETRRKHNEVWKPTGEDLAAEDWEYYDATADREERLQSLADNMQSSINRWQQELNNLPR